MTRNSPPEEGNAPENPEESHSQTERENSILDTAPGSMSDSQKRVFAHRRWYGIGPGGHEIETWTQQEIGEYLGVSERTVRRWVNEEPAPLFDGLPERERWFLFGLAVTNRDALEEYLVLLDLEDRLDSSSTRDSSEWTPGATPITSEEYESQEEESHLFDGLDEDFDPW